MLMLPSDKTNHVNNQATITASSTNTPQSPQKTEYMPTSVNFTQMASNLSKTVDDGITTYNAGDIIPDFSKICNVNVVIDNLTVINDHDTIGAGDFYLYVYATHLSPSLTAIWDQNQGSGYSIGSYNSGNFYDTNMFFTTVAPSGSWVGLGLYDDDAGSTDLIGYGSIQVLMQTFSYSVNKTFRQIINFSGDVFMGVIVTLSWAGPRNALDACKQYLPYLWIDIDITVPEPDIDVVYARLLRGYDSSVAKTTYCIQVIYYWTIERNFDGSILHYFDYEPMMIYVDPTVSWLPYRIAFDNGFYWNGDPNGDNIWWNCHDYRLYEELGYTGHVAGTYAQSIDITAAVLPFLGPTASMIYQIKSYQASFYASWDIKGYDSAWVNSVGIIVPVLTLETFYHTFDMGKSTGGHVYGIPDGADTWMTDTIIKSWYGNLQLTYSGGTHATSGNPTPWYQPFHWDILNPFNFPLVTTYDTLVNNIAAYNNAKASKTFWVQTVASFNCTFTIPISYTLAVPKTISPGTACWINGTLAVDATNTVLRVDYRIGFVLHVNLSWYKKDFDFTLKGYFLIDTNGLKVNFAGMTFTWAGITKTFENDYLSVTMALTPKIFGTLVEATVEFSVFSFLNTYFPQYSVFKILKEVIGEIVYSADIKLVGGIQGSIKANDAPIATFLFNSEAATSTSFSAKYTPSSSSLAISIGDIAYNLGFTVDHSIRLDFSKWLAFFIGSSDKTWNIGTYPDISVAIPLPIAPVQLYTS